MTLSIRFRFTQPLTDRGRRMAKAPLKRPSLELLEERCVPTIFWVTNTHDSGAGSRRQAIASANGCSGPDIVRFKNDSQGTITLTTGELSIAGDVRIDGLGASKVTLSGGGKSRVLNIAAGANVIIDGITVANGFMQG